MESLGTFATDTAGQLDVLGHDGHPLGVDGAQVGVLEQTYQVSLAGLLQSHDGRALEAQVGLEVLGDLTDQPLEGQLADEQLGALLPFQFVAIDSLSLVTACLCFMFFLRFLGRIPCVCWFCISCSFSSYCPPLLLCHMFFVQPGFPGALKDFL